MLDSPKSFLGLPPDWRRWVIYALRTGWRRWRRRPFTGIDHDAVMEHLSEEGSISVRYGVLTALSCGIAILGLLLSSPAVVIGAMLISPLMSPMVLFGFSLATLDHHLVIKSLKAIAFGMVLAILQAALIVWLSPLTSVTPEILARTKPNFFDLLVAVFSAIAGAYAVAHRKGETIVGVAIATALMPPLAVTGYGLAEGNWAIFAGASGLFMTNLLAIGLTASLVARLFGFGAAHPTHHRALHIVGIFAVFAFLSLPLVLSLKQIAHEAILTARVKSALAEYFAPEGHIYGVEVRFPENRPIEIDALVLTAKPRIGAEPDIRARLQSSLRQEVSLSLSQVPVRSQESLDRQAVEEMIGKTAASLDRQLQAHPDVALAATIATQVPRLDVSTDPTAKIVAIRAKTQTAEQLASLRKAGIDLKRRFPGWRFVFRFDGALPPVRFAEGSGDLDAANDALTADIAWAMQQSGATEARVLGRSDSAGRTSSNRRMALRRAETVALRLKTFGIEATAEAQYPIADQRRIEHEAGRAALRQAVVQSDGTPAGK